MLDNNVVETKCACEVRERMMCGEMKVQKEISIPQHHTILRLPGSGALDRCVVVGREADRQEGCAVVFKRLIELIQQ